MCEVKALRDLKTLKMMRVVTFKHINSLYGYGMMHIHIFQKDKGTRKRSKRGIITLCRAINQAEKLFHRKSSPIFPSSFGLQPATNSFIHYFGMDNPCPVLVSHI